MKILYDHQAFTMQYFGGISKCFCELIEHRSVGMKYEISIKQSNNIHLRDSNLLSNLQPVSLDYKSFLPNTSFKGKHWLYSHIISNIFATTEKLNERMSIDAIIKGEYDVFHPTFFSTYFLPYINNKPFVITIHDMIPEIYPQYFSKWYEESAIKRILCEKAKAIVAVSNQTKQDLIRLFGIDEKKIHVVYHGTPHMDNFMVERIVDDEYFLYVGQRGGYKNFIRTLFDFTTFLKQHKDVKLVCTGSNFNENERHIISELGIKHNLVYIKATEREMMSLYQNAIAFIYPSLYEGFGMPILEAFVNKCPVLLNAKSCFPEIGGDAALYFNSDDKGSNLIEMLEYIYNCNDSERDYLIKKGCSRTKSFTWNNASLELENVYKSL